MASLCWISRDLCGSGEWRRSHVFGHLLLFVDSGRGYYLQVAGAYGYPRYMNAGGYQKSLRESGKKEFRRLRVDVPDSNGANRYAEELLSKKWKWLMVPNNCVAFCEEVIKAGGGSWSSVRNLPTVATSETLDHRIQVYLNELEGEIYKAYGVPRF